MPPPRPEPDDEPTLRAMQAARSAREIAGDDMALGDEARRDAFCALLYGLAIGHAQDVRDGVPPDGGGPPADAPDEALAGRVDTLATRLVREVAGLPFRDACRAVDAVSDALVAADPDPAVLGLVQAGAAAAADWRSGDARAFASRVLQATAGDAFASERALRPRR